MHGGTNGIRGEPLRDDHMQKLQTPPILQFIVVGKNSPKRTERQSYLCPFFILAFAMHLLWNLRKNGSLFAILYEEWKKATNNRAETTNTGNPHRLHVAPSMSYGTLFPCYLKYKQINRTNVQGMIIMEQAIKSCLLSLSQRMQCCTETASHWLSHVHETESADPIATAQANNFKIINCAINGFANYFIIYLNKYLHRVDFSFCWLQKYTCVFRFIRHFKSNSRA